MTLTTEWLQDHIIPDPRRSIPKATVRKKYAKYCLTASLKGVNDSTLGKVLKSCFPSVETKRLGQRQKSEYFYVGISWKYVTDDDTTENQDPEQEK
jgi:hypothetical protein